ncbi:hypothetical protein D3C72_913460 [compost metagenome]
MAVVANIHEAKTTLSKLLERALDGEDVVIARAGKPVARLVKIEQESASVEARRVFGRLRGKVRFAKDWDSSETNNEVSSLFYGEGNEAYRLKGVAEE